MAIKIREYRDTDHTACVALCRELAQHHASIYEVSADVIKPQDTWLDDLTRKDGFAGCWVADVDNKVAGFYGLFAYGEEGEIEPVVVTASQRGQNIGTQLLRHAVAEAKKKKIRYLSIHPVARNKAAIKLFARLGFNLVGHIDMFQDLAPQDDRTWQSGLEILGQKLRY